MSYYYSERQGGSSRLEEYTLSDGTEVYLEEIKPRWADEIDERVVQARQRASEYSYREPRSPREYREHREPAGQYQSRRQPEQHAHQASRRQVETDRNPVFPGQYASGARQTGGAQYTSRQPTSSQHGQSGGGLAYGVDPLYDQWRSSRASNAEHRQPVERRPARDGENHPGYASFARAHGHEMSFHPARQQQSGREARGSGAYYELRR